MMYCIRAQVRNKRLNCSERQHELLTIYLNAIFNRCLVIEVVRKEILFLRLTSKRCQLRNDLADIS